MTTRLSFKNYLGYGAGDAANNLAFSMQGFFLLLYYTVVVGLDAKVVGTMFLVARLIDAGADLFAGRLVDITSTRWGKFRPFLLFLSLPLLLSSVAAFSVPDLSRSGQYLYAWVTYVALGVLYSLVNIPYGSLATAMTQDSTERSRLGSYRMLGAMGMILVIVAVVAPKISKLASSPDQLQGYFTTVTAIFVVVGMALYLFTFFTAREQVARPQERVSVRDTLRTFRSNSALGVLCLGSLFGLIGMFAAQTALAFYAAYVLGSSRLMVVLIAVSTVGSFAVVGVVPRLVPRIGKKRLLAWVAVVGAVASVALFLAPVTMPVVVVLYGVQALAVSALNALLFAFEPDTVDYGDWKTGHRTEGAAYAVFSFTRKVAQAISGALAAWALGLGGFDRTLPHQTASALTAIKAIVALSPGLFLVLGAVVIVGLFPMNEERYGRIIAELRARPDRVAPVESPAPLPPSGALASEVHD